MKFSCELSVAKRVSCNAGLGGPYEGEQGVRREGPDLGSKFRKFQSFVESWGYVDAPGLTRSRPR